MIRIIRMLEYEFPDYETMEKHAEKLAVPLNGKVRFGLMRIRSASIDTFERDDEDDEPLPYQGFREAT